LFYINPSRRGPVPGPRGPEALPGPRVPDPSQGVSWRKRQPRTGAEGPDGVSGAGLPAGQFGIVVSYYAWGYS